MNWTSIMQSENPTLIADFVRENPIDIAHANGFDLLENDLHGAWMDDMLNGEEDMTLQAHRGSYKTTCLSVVIPILIVTNPNRNIIFMRKTDDDVVEIIEQSKRILASDIMQGVAHAIHGKYIEFLKQNVTEIDTNLKTKSTGAPQLIGIGIGGSLTGKHGDKIIADDIVNLKDRASRAERERTKNVYQELQNIRNRGGKIINTGTPWHKDDAFSLMPNIRKYDCYSTGLIGKAALESLRQSMSPSLFAANYELQHIAAETALFDTLPRFTDDASLLRDGIAHIDAAYGGEDYTAFTCAKRVGDTIYAYGRIWQKDVDSCLDYIIQDANNLMCAPIHCEINADKGYLAKEIRRRRAAAKEYHESMNKYLKITTYLRKWWRNIVWLEGTGQEYIKQIMYYTEDAEHDDACDSASVICRILDKKIDWKPVLYI